MKKLIAVFALLLVCAPAFAQQTAIHSVVIGKGAGFTGFNAAVPGTTGQPLVSTGTTSDPAFGTVANSGLTPGPANTVKGSLDGASVSDEALPACTGVSQSLRWAAGVGFSCGAISVTTGYDMPINLGLSASASGNALTLTLTQASGSAPSSSNPVLVPFRSTTLTAGTVTWATISATKSVTIPSGATLGTSSSNLPFRVWIFLEYNAGAPQLAVATCSNTTTVFPCASWESTLPTSLAIGGPSNNAGVLYATAGVAADAFRIVGYCDYGSGLTTAGIWASACTTLQVFGPGVKKPGDVVQENYLSTASAATCSTSLLVTTVTNTITPTAAPNLIEVLIQFGAANAAAGNKVSFVVERGSTEIGQGATIGATGTSTVAFGSPTLLALDAPGSVTAQTYAGYCQTNSSSGNVNGGVLTLKEIMG